MTTVTAPAGLLDPTGKTDIADKLQTWIGSLPNGTNVNNMTTGVIPPGLYLNEGGTAGAVTFGKRFFSLETPGATFVQRIKRPFAVKAAPSNGNANLAGEWYIVYTPTSIVTRTFDGWLNKVSAFDRATAKCLLLNRARSFFNQRKSHAVRLRGVTTIGAAGVDPTFNEDFEAQDGFGFYGCTDCELDDCTDRRMFGNGLEATAFVESDGTYVPTTGLWVHDSGFSDFGRQMASLSYGGRFILERNDLAGSINGRALIDMEPTTNRNPPGQDATVQGVYVLNCNIGKHRLGMIAAGFTNGDVRWIRVSGCKGTGIGTSGTSYAQGVIFEDNISTDVDSTPNPYKFAKGPAWGGTNIIIRRNRDWYVSEAGVQFHDGQGGGGCTNYLVTGNDFRGRGATSAPQRQFIDNNVPAWSGQFVPFELPTPPHTLRDL